MRWVTRALKCRCSHRRQPPQGPAVVHPGRHVARPGGVGEQPDGLDARRHNKRMDVPAHRDRPQRAPTDREHDVHDPVGLPQREALAECRDGAALDGGGNARSRQGFRWLKAHKQLPVLRAALLAIQAQQDRDSVVVPEAVAA
jgi:hypothetical protein